MIYRDPIAIKPVDLPVVYAPLHPAYAHLDMFSLCVHITALHMTAQGPHVQYEIAAMQSEFHRRSVRN